MIEFLKERIIGGGKPKISRAQVMSARPIRNPTIEWDREARIEGQPAVALLRIPRRRDRWGNIVARLMKLPDFRKLELDEIGSDVWEMCDGTLTVEALTKAVCTKYRLNRRQGETSVTAYLKQLAERRLVALRGTKAPVSAKRSAPGARTGAGTARINTRRT